MPIITPVKISIALAIAAVLYGAAPAAAAGQAAEAQKNPRQRTTPIYATLKDGTPAVDLKAADLEVLVGGTPVDGFALTKGGSHNKLVFLIFDTGTVSSSLLSKSKKIAQETISRADGRVRFAILSLDPGAGLRLVAGPSTDRGYLLKAMTKDVISRQSEYFRSRATSGTSIRDAYPQYHDITPSKMAQEEKKRDHQQDRQVSSVIIASLRTLNEILARFPESDKIVHLFSCGIPGGGAVNTSQIVYEDENVELVTPDGVIFDQIKSAGQAAKKSGGLLFLINPGGTRAGQDDTTSGEGSLRMLANESGGRFLEGADKDIIGALAAAERGYYQLSLPEMPNLPEAGIAIEIRPKIPGLTVSTVSVLAPTRKFSRLTPEERQAMILSVLTDGLVGDIDLKVSRVQVDIRGSGDEISLTAQLPFELAQSEWDIYKVWRDPVKGEVSVEKEHVLSSGPLLTFGMAPRENAIQDAALVHAKSGTVLVCQSKGGPKS